MPIQPVGINFSALGNITAPEFNFSTTSEGFLNSMVSSANDVTNGYLGLIILLGLWIFLAWYLGDVSQFGEFRYSFIRAGGIASAICGILGLVALNIGIFTSFYHVAIFLGITMITTMWVWIEER